METLTLDGLDKEPKIAGMGDRVLAFLLDGAILFFPCLAVHFSIPFVAPLILKFLYYPVFHASALQATIGKKVMGIRVADANGKAISLPNAFIRELVATASTCCFFAGHFVAFFTAKHQAVHDLAVGSFVTEAPATEISLWEAWTSTVRRMFYSVSESATSTFQSQPSVGRQITELERLNDLRKQGVISEEEFQRLKSKLV